MILSFCSFPLIKRGPICLISYSKQRATWHLRTGVFWSANGRRVERSFSSLQLRHMLGKIVSHTMIKAYLLFYSKASSFRYEDVCVSTLLENGTRTLVNERVHLSSKNLETFLQSLNCIFREHRSEWFSILCETLSHSRDDRGGVELLWIEFKALSQSIDRFILLLPVLRL